MEKKYSAYVGVLAIAIAFLTIGITTSIHADWFSWSSNALSDLGALDTTYNQIFNGGMILTGILGAFFGFGLMDYFKNKVSKIGAIIFIFGMGFLVLVGVYPSGTEPHVTVSLLFFGVTAFGILLTGIGEIQEGGILGSIVVLIVLVLIPVAWWSSINFSGVAIPEMVGVLGFTIFTLLYAVKLGTKGATRVRNILIIALILSILVVGIIVLTTLLAFILFFLLLPAIFVFAILILLLIS